MGWAFSPAVFVFKKEKLTLSLITGKCSFFPHPRLPVYEGGETCWCTKRCFSLFSVLWEAAPIVLCPEPVCLAPDPDVLEEEKACVVPDVIDWFPIKLLFTAGGTTSSDQRLLSKLHLLPVSRLLCSQPTSTWKVSNVQWRGFTFRGEKKHFVWKSLSFCFWAEIPLFRPRCTVELPLLSPAGLWSLLLLPAPSTVNKIAKLYSWTIKTCFLAAAFAESGIGQSKQQVICAQITWMKMELRWWSLRMLMHDFRRRQSLRCTFSALTKMTWEGGGEKQERAARKGNDRKTAARKKRQLVKLFRVSAHHLSVFQ